MSARFMVVVMGRADGVIYQAPLRVKFFESFEEAHTSAAQLTDIFDSHVYISETRGAFHQTHDGRTIYRNLADERKKRNGDV